MARGFKKKNKRLLEDFVRLRITDGILMETKVIGMKANTVETKFYKHWFIKMGFI